VRRIIVILALGLLIYLIRRLQGRLQPRRPPAGPGDRREPERLVRDRVCNTFLPPASALSIEHDGVQHYFCSPACRDRFLQQVHAGARNLTPGR
jgi:YHS domain-containing protein